MSGCFSDIFHWIHIFSTHFARLHGQANGIIAYEVRAVMAISFDNNVLDISHKWAQTNGGCRRMNCNANGMKVNDLLSIWFCLYPCIGYWCAFAIAYDVQSFIDTVDIHIRKTHFRTASDSSCWWNGSSSRSSAHQTPNEWVDQHCFSRKYIHSRCFSIDLIEHKFPLNARAHTLTHGPFATRIHISFNQPVHSNVHNEPCTCARAYRITLDN